MVKANDRATYYISGQACTAVIQTDTDFGTATFIIDDRKAEKANLPVFNVTSNLKPIRLQGVSTLQRIPTSSCFEV